MHQTNKTSVARAIILVMAISITFLGIFTDLRNTLRHGGIDLRNRIVGARLLTQGIDPYYYRWQPGDSETLRDPFDQLELPISRVTVAPVGLALYAPFAGLPYHIQRLIWFVLQQLAFLGSLALLVFTNANTRNKAVLAISLLFMNSNYSWRLHVETGQIYIFYVFLIALSYWFLFRKMRFNGVMAGLSLGLAIAIRPPLIVMALPMLLFKKIKLFTITLLGTVVWLLLSVLLFGYQVWLNYFSAMNLISQLSRGELKSPELKEIVLPQILEGVVFGLKDASKTEQTSVALKLTELSGIQFSIGHFVLIIAVIFLVYLLIASKLYRDQRNYQFTPLDLMVILGGVLVLITDFLIPAPRYSYNDVLYLIPLIPTLKYVQWNSYIDIPVLCLLALGLLSMGGLFVWLPFSHLLVGEVLVLAALMFASLLLLRNPATTIK